MIQLGAIGKLTPSSCPYRSLWLFSTYASYMSSISRLVPSARASRMFRATSSPLIHSTVGPLFLTPEPTSISEWHLTQRSFFGCSSSNSKQQNRHICSWHLVQLNVPSAARKECDEFDSGPTQVHISGPSTIISCRSVKAARYFGSDLGGSWM